MKCFFQSCYADEPRVLSLTGYNQPASYCRFTQLRWASKFARRGTPYALKVIDRLRQLITIGRCFMNDPRDRATVSPYAEEKLKLPPRCWKKQKSIWLRLSIPLGSRLKSSRHTWNGIIRNLPKPIRDSEKKRSKRLIRSGSAQKRISANFSRRCDNGWAAPPKNQKEVSRGGWCVYKYVTPDGVLNYHGIIFSIIMPALTGLYLVGIVGAFLYIQAQRDLGSSKIVLFAGNKFPRNCEL